MIIFFTFEWIWFTFNMNQLNRFSLLINNMYIKQSSYIILWWFSYISIGLVPIGPHKIELSDLSLPVLKWYFICVFIPKENKLKFCKDQKFIDLFHIHHHNEIYLPSLFIENDNTKMISLKWPETRSVLSVFQWFMVMKKSRNIPIHIFVAS